MARVLGNAGGGCGTRSRPRFGDSSQNPGLGFRALPGPQLLSEIRGEQGPA